MKELRQRCLREAKRAVAESVDEDDLIVKAIAMYDTTAEHVTSMAASLSEWYGLYAPEVAREADPEEVPSLTQRDRDDVHTELDIEESMGADLAPEHVRAIKRAGSGVHGVYDMLDDIEDYLAELMSSYCYNTLQVAGPLVGARLLREAGSLKDLATMPGSKIQVLGAEKAMFRHVRTGAKPPRFGHLFHHPLVQGKKDEDRGKVARAIANKLALAARTDFFSEKRNGDELRGELEENYG